MTQFKFDVIKILLYINFIYLLKSIVHHINTTLHVSCEIKSQVKRNTTSGEISSHQIKITVEL